MAYFSMQTSAWILTLITIDRYLIISSNTWMQKYSKSMKFSLIVILIIILITAFINFPVALLNGKINKSPNVTQEKRIICYSTSYIIFWQKFSLLLECIFPLIIMTIFNIMLVKKTYKSSTKFNSAIQNSSKSKSNYCNRNVSGMNTSPKESHIQLSKASNSFIEDESQQNLAQHTKCSNKFLIPDKHESLRKTTNKKLNNKSDNFLEIGPRRSSLKSNPKIKFLEVNKNSSEISPPKMETISSYEENEGDDEEFVSINGPINQKDDSLANLNFLKSGDIPFENLNYTEPSGISFYDPHSCIDQIEHGDGSSDTNLKTVALQRKFNTTNGHSERKVSNLRNRRIVVMLSLLTLSFTISTVPSSIFYTFFRPLINDKPYKRLFTLIFNLIRHLSHAFNFVIYFTSSSVIKRELKESIKEFREKNFLSRDCFLSSLDSFKKIICFLPLYLKRDSPRKSNGYPSSVVTVTSVTHVASKEDFEVKHKLKNVGKNSIFRNRTNSIITINSESKEEQRETFSNLKDDSFKFKKKSLQVKNKNVPIKESSL